MRGLQIDKLYKLHTRMEGEILQSLGSVIDNLVLLEPSFRPTRACPGIPSRARLPPSTCCQSSIPVLSMCKFLVCLSGAFLKNRLCHFRLVLL